MSMVGISAFSSISTGMVGFAAERVTTTFLAKLNFSNSDLSCLMKAAGTVVNKHTNIQVGKDFMWVREQLRYPIFVDRFAN